ncbi:hypothetical protein [Kingella potus]|uniref:hypothetical protein n=1 Tax=Kingella potus TaxID=265175 RepID=UPI0015584C54|nr:hypothetical protein [Kingella potus]UOP00073.1 hypothetical protein LVJ84_08775 [Kingella potus]
MWHSHARGFEYTALDRTMPVSRKALLMYKYKRGRLKDCFQTASSVVRAVFQAA